ncbi:hypothetical protein RFI_33136, partial [Reticulomyxa filosa]
LQYPTSVLFVKLIFQSLYNNLQSKCNHLSENVTIFGITQIGTHITRNNELRKSYDKKIKKLNKLKILYHNNIHKHTYPHQSHQIREISLRGKSCNSQFSCDQIAFKHFNQIIFCKALSKHFTSIKKKK